MKLFPAIALIACSVSAGLAQQHLAPSTPLAVGTITLNQPPHTTLKWLRRTALVANCASGMIFETYALRHAVSQGARVTGMFADANGHPKYGLLFGIAGASCGLSVLRETPLLGGRNKSAGVSWFDIVENGGATGLSVWTGMRYLNLKPAVATPLATRN
jgi:hypothetical protein